MIKKRVALTEGPSNAVEAMAQELRESETCLNFSDSQLVARLVEIFLEKYFPREKKRLQKEFFDRRKALQLIVKNSASDEDLEKSLNALLRKPKGK